MKLTISTVLNYVRNLLLFRVRYPWVEYGMNVHCQLSVTFGSSNNHIILKNNVGIGYRCLFQSDTEIGNKVLIASDVAFLNSDEHCFDIVGKAIWDSGKGCKHKIIIEDDVWIGHGAIILAPAHIERGSVIAAGSVVKANVPRYAVVAGVPAKIIKMRFTPQQIEEHESLLAQSGEMV